jgi:hypothetical protein
MGKYDKYICTTLQKRHLLPGPTPEERDNLAAEGKRMSMEHVLWLDKDVFRVPIMAKIPIWPASIPTRYLPELMKTVRRILTPMFLTATTSDRFPAGYRSDHLEDTSSMGMIMEDEITLDKSWYLHPGECWNAH